MSDLVRQIILFVWAVDLWELVGVGAAVSFAVIMAGVGVMWMFSKRHGDDR